MKISANWVLDQLPWLEGIPNKEIERKMAILGHRVDITPEVWEFIPSTQRIDIIGVSSVLREIAAGFGKSYGLCLPNVRDEDIGSIYEQLDADIWSDTLYNRFTAKMGVRLNAGKTPDWMKQRLFAAGHSCSDNIEDIANYVRLEYGQTVFLLNYKAIYDGTITIREAFGYETAEDHILPYGVPILESGEEILAVPGFWTSQSGAVSSDAESVIIAAINYPLDVRSLCEEAFNLQSMDGSYQDPLMTITAVDRVCQLIQELGYGQVLDGTIDILNFVPNPVKLDLKEAYSQDNTVTQEEFHTLLKIIGISEDGVIPSWRPDLDSPEAIALEVARLHRVNTQTKD